MQKSPGRSVGVIREVGNGETVKGKRKKFKRVVLVLDLGDGGHLVDWLSSFSSSTCVLCVFIKPAFWWACTSFP